jgi:hypothetical protein
VRSEGAVVKLRAGKVAGAVPWVGGSGALIFGGDSGEEAVALGVGGVLQHLVQGTAQGQARRMSAAFGVADRPLREP